MNSCTQIAPIRTSVSVLRIVVTNTSNGGTCNRHRQGAGTTLAGPHGVEPHSAPDPVEALARPGPPRLRRPRRPDGRGEGPPRPGPPYPAHGPGPPATRGPPEPSR